MSSNSIGQLLDALGVKADLDEGELVNGVVVLLETIDDDGDVSLQVIEDDSTSWVRKIGMLKVALDAATNEFAPRHHHDHDHDDD